MTEFPIDSFGFNLLYGGLWESNPNPTGRLKDRNRTCTSVMTCTIERELDLISMKTLPISPWNRRCYNAKAQGKLRDLRTQALVDR